MSNTRDQVNSAIGPFVGVSGAPRLSPTPATTKTRLGEHPRIRDVQWSLVYVAYLAYIFVVVTYQVRLGDVAVAAGLIGLLAQSDIRTPRLLGWLGAFALWCVFGYVQTAYPGEVWESVIVMGKIWLICLVAFNALRTPAQIRFFMIFFLCCFACYPARGAIFNYVGGYTLVGRAIWNFTYANPNDLAALAFLPLSMAAALFVTDKSFWIKRGALASLFVLPILILMTQSRGGALALAFFAVMAFLGQRRRSRVVLLLMPLAIIAITFSSGVLQRFEQTSLTGDATSDATADRMAASSAEQRWAILKTAASIARDHPGFGVGFGAYSVAHATYAPMMGPKSAHNTFLEVAAETGFPGLMIFVILLGTTFYRAERARKRCEGVLRGASLQLWYIEAGLVAYLVAGIFGSFEEFVFLYLHIALIWALADVTTRQVRRMRTSQGTAHANAT